MLGQQNIKICVEFAKFTSDFTKLHLSLVLPVVIPKCFLLIYLKYIPVKTQLYSIIFFDILLTVHLHIFILILTNLMH
jgi:hypothetical protein